MATRPRCPRCGIAMKNVYQRVGSKAATQAIVGWATCPDDGPAPIPRRVEHDGKVA